MVKGFRVYGLGLRVQGLGVRVYPFRVYGLGLRVAHAFCSKCATDMSRRPESSGPQVCDARVA